MNKEEIEANSNFLQEILQDIANNEDAPIDFKILNEDMKRTIRMQNILKPEKFLNVQNDKKIYY